MNVFQAIWWSISAWKNDVSKKTIKQCWIKSQVLAPKYGPSKEEKDIKEVERLYAVNLAKQHAELQDMMIEMQQFLRKLKLQRKSKRL